MYLQVIFAAAASSLCRLSMLLCGSGDIMSCDGTFADGQMEGGDDGWRGRMGKCKKKGGEERAGI